MPQPKTLNRSILKEYAEMRERWILLNIKLDLSAERVSTVICRVCKSAMEVANSDSFQPFSVWINVGTMRQKTKMLNSNKDVLKYFQELHWEGCEKTHNYYFEQQIKALAKA